MIGVAIQRAPITLGATIHPHPALSETVAMAAEMFDGSITDLTAPKKKAHG